MNYELQRLQQLAKSNKSYKRAYLEYCRRYEAKTNIFLNTLHKRDLTNFEIVIAHYREPTKILNSWLEKYYRLGVKTTVYHKGGWNSDSYDFASDNIITLPNIGRESHTYLRHILDRWNNLAEWTFFAQADISDHWQKAEMLPLNYYLLSGKMENRNFVGIERKLDYFNSASERINNTFAPYQPLEWKKNPYEWAIEMKNAMSKPYTYYNMLVNYVYSYFI